MSAQLALPLAGPDLDGLAPRAVALWESWHDTDEGRAVLARFSEVALAEIATGATKIAVDRLIWQVRRPPPDGLGLSINNTARSAIARWLVWRHPMLKGMVDLRDRRGRAA